MGQSSTPAEPASVDEEDQFSKARSQIIDAQGGETDRLDEQASRSAALDEFSTLKIHNGCGVVDKWKSEYLCVAMQFTLLFACRRSRCARRQTPVATAG